MASTEADATASSAGGDTSRRIPATDPGHVGQVVDVGLSKLPTAEDLGANVDRELVRSNRHHHVIVFRCCSLSREAKALGLSKGC